MSMIPNVDSILIVEDEQKVSRLVEAYLARHGLKVTAVRSGEDAIKAFHRDSSYDMIMLDLNLPRLQGLDVLRVIRRESTIPVMVVSARIGPEERVRVLEEGADDFLAKPYYPEELVARVRALLRRARFPSSERPAWSFDLLPRERCLRLCGKLVSLTQREYDLLAVLAEKPGRLFTREQLLQAAWGRTDPKAFRRVDLYISRLRPRVQGPDGQELLESVYGKGYRLKADPQRGHSEVGLALESADRQTA